MKYYVDWRFLALMRRNAPHFETQVYALRCDCGVLTLGCKDHWFCGLCEPCRAQLHDEDAA